jgi:hypothetical protein
MKLVKFNVSTAFRNIPDSKYKAEVKKFETLREDSFDKWVEIMKSGHSKYDLVDVKIGQEIAVPNWYYDAHKNDEVNIGRSFDKYRDRQGNIIPFDVTEAKRHGDIAWDEKNITMKSVARFELVEDLDKNAEVS